MTFTTSLSLALENLPWRTHWHNKHILFSSGPFWLSPDLPCFTNTRLLLFLFYLPFNAFEKKKKQSTFAVSTNMLVSHLKSPSVPASDVVELYRSLCYELPVSYTCFFAVILPWVFVYHLMFLECRIKYGICDLRYVWHFKVSKWSVNYWMISKCCIGACLRLV